MAQRDYYDILGVDRGSEDDAIKTAYRKMAMKYHPDRNPGDKGAEESFKEATQAYEVLKDPQKRRQYDQFGHAAFSGAGAGHGGTYGGYDQFDLSDALRAFMRDFGGGGGGGGSVFEEFFGGGARGGRRGKSRGEDLRVRIPLTLEEIATGVEKQVKVKRLVRCDTCGGTGVATGSHKKTCTTCKGHGQVRTMTRTFLGTVQQVTTCSTCHGSGEVITDPCKSCDGQGRTKGTSTISINVPAGVSSGNYMTIENMGNAAPGNGEAGDLIAVFEETEHDLFVRRGDHVISEIPVSFLTVVLGGSITVRTLDGEHEIKVSAGTQPGQVIKLRGKGIPHLHGGGRGDHLVQIVVWVPNKLSGEDKRILEKLSGSDSFKAPAPSRSFFEKLRESLGV